jgi:alcohol dehydrogenase class IV
MRMATRQELGPDLPPAAVILDAELTLSTPERLWLSTGIRALDHAVGRSIPPPGKDAADEAVKSESLYRPLVPYPAKVISYEAISLLFKYLPISKQNPGDIAARQKLQVAAWMSLWPATLSKPVFVWTP